MRNYLRNICNTPAFWGLTLYFSLVGLHGFFQEYSITRALAALVIGMLVSVTLIIIAQIIIGQSDIFSKESVPSPAISDKEASYIKKYPKADQDILRMLLERGHNSGISSILRQYMYKKGLTYPQMLEKLNMSDEAGRKFIYGKRKKLYSPTYKKLEKAFNIPEKVWRNFKA